MKIAVLEFVCGGGTLPAISNSIVPTETDPLDAQAYRELFREGFRMLESLAKDLASCGHEVVTCIDHFAADAGAVESLEKHSIHSYRIHSNAPWLEHWLEVAKGCDQTIVIAPELDHHLVQIVDYLRTQQVSVLASSSEFLKATSDKLLTANLLKSKSVPHPQTWSVDEYLGEAQAHSSVIRGTPVTLKRRDGAGCVSMRYFPNQYSLESFLANSRQATELANMIVQPWLPGRAASLVVLVDSNRQTLLGSFDQCISLDSTDTKFGEACVVYEGGFGPAVGVSSSELERFVKRVLDAMPPGALGWIGMDFLIPEHQSNQEFVLIEINPRLTTSYLGYRQWYGAGLANCLAGNQTAIQSLCWQNAPEIEFKA